MKLVTKCIKALKIKFGMTSCIELIGLLNMRLNFCAKRCNQTVTQHLQCKLLMFGNWDLNSDGIVFSTIRFSWWFDQALTPYVLYEHKKCSESVRISDDVISCHLELEDEYMQANFKSGSRANVIVPCSHRVFWTQTQMSWICSRTRMNLDLERGRPIPQHTKRKNVRKDLNKMLVSWVFTGSNWKKGFKWGICRGYKHMKSVFENLNYKIVAYCISMVFSIIMRSTKAISNLVPFDLCFLFLICERLSWQYFFFIVLISFLIVWYVGSWSVLWQY